MGECQSQVYQNILTYFESTHSRVPELLIILEDKLIRRPVADSQLEEEMLIRTPLPE